MRYVFGIILLLVGIALCIYDWEYLWKKKEWDNRFIMTIGGIFIMWAILLMMNKCG